MIAGLRQALMNVLFLGVLAVAGLMLLPAALGFHRYVILTGSMTGTYNRGAIVFDKPVATSTLTVGTPITYAPPPGTSSHDLITHRIYKITASKGGARVFQTKGDFNKDPDAWHFLLPRATQDRVVFHVPWIGFLFELLSIRRFRLVLIGVPALLAAFAVARGMWREAGALGDVDPDALPEWGLIDRDGLLVHDALGPLPALVPVFVGVPELAAAGSFAWAARPAPAGDLAGSPA